MSANVVKFPKARPLVHLVDSPVALNLLRNEMLASKMFYKDIAAKAQVSGSTVSNIASGKTQLPRLETIIRLLSAMGWTIQAVRRDT